MCALHKTLTSFPLPRGGWYPGTEATDQLFFAVGKLTLNVGKRDLIKMGWISGVGDDACTAGSRVLGQQETLLSPASSCSHHPPHLCLWGGGGETMCRLWTTRLMTSLPNFCSIDQTALVTGNPALDTCAGKSPRPPLIPHSNFTHRWALAGGRHAWPDVLMMFHSHGHRLPGAAGHMVANASRCCTDPPPPPGGIDLARFSARIQCAGRRLSRRFFSLFSDCTKPRPTSRKDKI